MKISSVVQGLLDNKKEYQDHLLDVITEPMVMNFQTMYEANLKTNEARAHGPLQSFQDLLTKIPSWNQIMVSEQYEQIRERSGCSYIQDLIRAILITYVKLNMASQKGSTDIQKLKVRVPSGENFVHRCMILAAREMWKQPYLLYHQVRTLERQKNLVELTSLVRKAIRGAIRMYVPMEQLVMHVHEAADEMDSASEDSPSDTSSEESESETESESDFDTEDETEDESEEDDVDSPIEVIHKNKKDVEDEESEGVESEEDEPEEDLRNESENVATTEEVNVELENVATTEDVKIEVEDVKVEPENVATLDPVFVVNEVVDVPEMKDLMIHTPGDASESESEPEDVYETQPTVSVEEEERKEITILGKEDVATKNKEKQMAYGTLLLNRGQLHRPKISRNNFTAPKTNAFF